MCYLILAPTLETQACKTHPDLKVQPDRQCNLRVFDVSTPFSDEYSDILGKVLYLLQH